MAKSLTTYRLVQMEDWYHIIRFDNDHVEGKVIACSQDRNEALYIVRVLNDRAVLDSL